MSQTVVYCSDCGHEIPSGAGFCRECGHDLTARATRFCRECGADVPVGAEFCRACGTAQAVEEPASAAAAQPEPASTFDTPPTATDEPSAEFDEPPTALDPPPPPVAAPPPAAETPPPPLDTPPSATDEPPAEFDEPAIVGDAPPTVFDWPPTTSDAPPPPFDAPPPATETPPPGRRRGLLVGSLLVLVLAAAGGAYLAFGQKDSSDNAAKAGTRADVAQVTPTPAVTEVAPTVTPTPTITATATATATATPTPDAGVLPAGSPDQFAGDIQAVLADFHQSIVGHDYRAAWNLLSARKQAKELRVDGYPKWRSAQASLAPYLDPSGLRATVQDVDRATGVALVKVSGMGWSAPNARCSEWSGFTWVKYEDGAWRYDPGFSTTPQREREWKSRYGQLLGASC